MFCQKCGKEIKGDIIFCLYCGAKIKKNLKTKKDYYEILGVSINTPKDEIKRAYHILAHQYHPDKNNGNEKRFKEINEAYRVLSGDRSKEEYDKVYSSNLDKEEVEEEQNSSENIPIKNIILPLVYIVSLVISFILIRGIFLLISSEDSSVKTNTTSYPNSSILNNKAASNIINNNINTVPKIINSQTGNQAPNIESKNIDKTVEKNAKCIIEDKNVKICDLSYSDSFYSTDYRNISVEGNKVACINMNTGAVSEGDVGKLRVTTKTAFCVTDWGYAYIDPNIKISKHYEGIIRDNYDSPYKISQQFDTCIWTYEDGSGAIPYLTILSSVGPRTGYNVKAFCVNGNSQVDIYSYKE